MEDADFANLRFDKALAINVRLFRTKGRREFDVLRRALKPTSALYLIQQHPSANRTQAVRDELQSALTSHGFVVREVMSEGSGVSTMTCIAAGPPGTREDRPGRGR